MNGSVRPIAQWPIRRSHLLGAGILVLLVAAVFYPIVGFEFADIDVGRQLIENPHVRGLSAANLRHIFTSRSTTSYYPVRSLSLAIDYQLWGLNPAGFGLTNGLLHLANVLLVYALLLRLLSGASSAVESLRCRIITGSGTSSSPLPRNSPSTAQITDSLTLRGSGGEGQGAGATARERGSNSAVVPAVLGASLLAVHPLVVEPVAWIGGREELLMTLGALGCIHFHISAGRLAGEEGRARLRWAYRCGAVFCCLAACLSNAVGAVIPALVVAYDLIVAKQASLLRTLRTSAPLWGIAIATIVIKKLGEYLDPPSEVGAFTVDRLLLIAGVYGINLQRLFWPTNLAIFYTPLSPESWRDSAVVLGTAAVVGTLVLLWWVRRQSLLLFGLIWFGIALAPASQIMVHHIHRADRFFYLALPGIALAAAYGLRHWCAAAVSRWVQAGGMLTAAGVLVLLAAQSAAQVRTWQDSITIWQNCVRVAPQNTRFRIALADRLAERGQNRRAIEELETVLRMEPRNNAARAKLAWLLVSSDEELRDTARGLALAESAYRAHPALFRSLATIRSEMGNHCAAEQRYAEAFTYYESALAVDPGNQAALTDLAWLLATCGDPTLRDPERAVSLAELARRLNKEFSASQYGVLAVTYAQAGHRDKAVVAARQALSLASDQRDAQELPELIARLKTYDLAK